MSTWMQICLTKASVGQALWDQESSTLENGNLLTLCFSPSRSLMVKENIFLMCVHFHSPTIFLMCVHFHYPTFYGRKSVNQKWNPPGLNIPKANLKLYTIIISSGQYQRKASAANTAFSDASSRVKYP